MFVLFALLLLFAACKGESPTSPTTTPPSTNTTGGNTPPSGASVTLTVSNANPLTSSDSLITAAVTQNGQPVPNGTAVQFTASGSGTFRDVGAVNSPAPASVIKTTTNGIATATLTSGTAGTVTVTATVNNVSKSTTVTFTAQPVTPPPANTTPTVTGISPQTGRPEGGETLTITGKNFRAPVRVVFTCQGTAGATPDPAGCNGQTTKEALVVSVTDTTITAITPQFNVPAGKALQLGVSVINAVGTPNEAPAASSTPFIETSLSLTPTIRSLSPTSGPIGGGTRVSIFGDSFQAPVQVFFGAAEAQVINTTFSEIIVMSPRASDTAPAGSGTVTGPVQVLVRNVGSGTSATSPQTFRYTPKMQITTINPTVGPITGGTKVTIDGTGFDDPLAVSIGGFPAQVIRVSGTEVVAITQQPLGATSCGNLSGIVSVTNTENGDSATSTQQFTYIVPLPQVVSATSPTTPGGTTSVTVLNAQGIPRILIGTTPATITGTTTNPDGTTTFTVQVPSTLKLDTQACANGGFQAPIPTAFGVTYTSLTTGCTSTFANGLTVTPPNTAVLALSPTQFNPFSATVKPATAGPPAPPATVTPSPSQTVNVGNTGTAPLTITSATTTCSPLVNHFAVAVPASGTVLNQCDVAPVTAQYNGTTTAGTSDSCTITLNTTAGNRTFTLTGTSQ